MNDDMYYNKEIPSHKNVYSLGKKKGEEVKFIHFPNIKEQK